MDFYTDAIEDAAQKKALPASRDYWRAQALRLRSENEQLQARVHDLEKQPATAICALLVQGRSEDEILQALVHHMRPRT